MKRIFYIFLIGLSGILGQWIFIVISRGIAAGYFLFSPGRVSVGIHFYRALFPKRAWLFHLMCVWRQYQNFTYVYLDRWMVQQYGNVTYTSEGWRHIDVALKNKTGGVILMSHLGNWDVAAHLMKQKYTALKLLLYMGRQHKEEIERLQKKSLHDSGITIVAVDRDGGGPFDIVDGVTCVKQGGLISMTGDVIWKADQRKVRVNFLNHTAMLPEIPYIFALLSGVPLFFFFTFRSGRNRYHFTISEPLYLKAATRKERAAVIQKAAQKYADSLEEALRKHPFEWYHFEPFLDA